MDYHYKILLIKWIGVECADGEAAVDAADDPAGAGWAGDLGGCAGGDSEGGGADAGLAVCDPTHAPSAAHEWATRRTFTLKRTSAEHWDPQSMYQVPHLS